MSDINSQLKKFERKVRLHEATNKYIVEIVQKGINWLEKRAKAIDDWQDQLVQTHNASIQAIQAIKDQESREVERLQNQIAETKLNTQDALDSVSGTLARATQSADKARKGLDIARNQVSPGSVAIRNPDAGSSAG